MRAVEQKLNCTISIQGTKDWREKKTIVLSPFLILSDLLARSNAQHPQHPELLRLTRESLRLEATIAGQSTRCLLIV